MHKLLKAFRFDFKFQFTYEVAGCSVWLEHKQQEVIHHWRASNDSWRIDFSDPDQILKFISSSTIIYY